MFLKNGDEEDIVILKGFDLLNIVFFGMSLIDENEKKKYKNEYFKYILKYQILCKQMFCFGNIVDGGWDICYDVQFCLKFLCIVYLFGINYDFFFDEDMEKIYGCDVFCFDFSMKIIDYKYLDYISFYNVGLDDRNKEVMVSGEIWKFKILRII